MSVVTDTLDALHEGLDIARRMRDDRAGMVGYGIAHLYEGDPIDGSKLIVPFGNLITDAGDLYCAGKLIAAIAPTSPAAPTAATGMKLGSGSAGAATKTEAGLRTYIAASNNLFSASWPVTVNLGAGLGVNAQYKTDWLAGDTTAADIDEVALVNDAAADADSSAANTYSYAFFTSINKLAADTLAITWNWKCLGA